MKLKAPKYFSEFKCIADKCQHSCCIGWEIDVDSDTLEKHKNSQIPYCQKVVESISLTDTPHFILKENDRCPHLENNGLCRIITEMSEDYLCDICREHPRFYNFTINGKEVGLGMACEEASRIILSSDDYNVYIDINEIDDYQFCSEFNAVNEREKIYNLLKSNDTYENIIKSLQEHYNVSINSTDNDKYINTISSFEYLNEDNKKLFSCFSGDRNYPEEFAKILERALAYFLYRYTSEAYDEAEFRVSVGLSLFLEHLLASLTKCCEKQDFQSIVELARMLSEEIEYSEENIEKIKNLFIK